MREEWDYYGYDYWPTLEKCGVLGRDGNLDFKKNLNKGSLICRECKTLSKQSTYYDPWSGILCYNLRMFPIERAPLSIDFLNEICNKKLQKGQVIWTF